MKFNHVSSSAIEKVAYVPFSRTMRVVFHTGKVYDYVGVSQELYNKFISADSIGRFYNRYIKDKIESIALDTEDSPVVIPCEMIDAISLFGGSSETSTKTVDSVDFDGAIIDHVILKVGTTYSIVKKDDLMNHVTNAKKSGKRVSAFEFGKTIIDW